MSSSILTQMGKYQVGILIHLVGILGAVSCLGCKGELSHTIVELLGLGSLGGLDYRLGGCDLTGDGGTQAVSTVRSLIRLLVLTLVERRSIVWLLDCRLIA